MPRRLIFTQLLTLLCHVTWVMAVLAHSASAQSGPNSLTGKQHQETYGVLSNSELLNQRARNDPYALLELGNRLAAGSKGLPKNTSEAARLFSLAYRSGYPGSPSLNGLSVFPIRAERSADPSGTSQPPTDALPSPEILVSVPDGDAPLTTTLSLSPEWTGNAQIYSWDLNPANENLSNSDTIVIAGELNSTSITATFSQAGRHSIRLTVMDNVGRTVTGHTTIIVNEPVTEPPTDPVPVFPADEALLIANDTVQFQWQASLNAESYDFYFFDGVTPLTRPFLIGYSAEEICSGGVCSLALPIDLPLGGSHIWRVRAVNPLGSTEWSRSRFSVIEPITQAPSTPLLLGPDSGSVVEYLSEATFGWVPADRAQSYQFTLTNAANETQLVKTLSAANCSDSACTFIEPVNLTAFETYAWSVAAVNQIGSSVSDERILKVIPQPTRAPQIPTNIAPVSGSQFTPAQVTSFGWTHDAQTAFYEFHFFNQTNGELTFTYNIDPTEVCDATQCSISQTIDLPIAPLHAWRVRGKNSLGTTGWTRNTFSVVPPVNDPPNTPTPITPVANALIETSETVAFTWEKSAFANRYLFELSNEDGVLTDTTVSQSACGNSTCSLVLPISTGGNTTYTWTVQAENANGLSSAQQTSFVVIDAPSELPPAVTMITPSENDVFVQGSDVPIVWNQVANASSYDVMLEDIASASTTQTSALSPLDICLESSCSHTINMNISPGANQALRVRAVNSLGASAWSRIVFKVLQNSAPAAPNLVSPLDGTFFTDIETVTVIWSPIADATSYDVALADSTISGINPTDVCAFNSELASTECQYTFDLTALNSPESESESLSLTWQVRGTTPAGTSDWSPANFSVITDTNATAPIAAFSLNNFTDGALGATPLSIIADPNASSDDVGIVQFIWDLGDGSPQVQRSDDSPIAHVYSESGSYTLSLTVVDAAGEMSTAVKSVTTFDPANTLSEIEASRLLAQATFGATEQDILAVRALGIETWLEQQFSLKGDDHLDYVNVHSNGSNRWPRHEVWWQDVVEGEDQLRQRVAFALSQLFVVSDIGYTLSNSQYGVTHFYDILRNNAFGNYRELLESVTKSPVMGLYLSMLQNSKGDVAASTRPDENYAREVLQLFSLGVNELNLDGTSTGEPAYTQQNVEEFARVFTGWNYKNAGSWNRGLSTGQDLISPMEPFENYHDTDSKTLLAGMVNPAGLSANEDLELALDNIANHPNVAPFIAKHLIQRLTTSNPTPQYVERVATVFNDNGLGIRGDLRAVVKAILIDAEARTSNRPPHFGKLREPVLRLSNLWRAFSVSRGTDNSSRGEFNTASPTLDNLDEVTGQAVLKSPSVFNFFKPEFAAIGPVSSNNLVAPEFEVMTESNEIATSNRIGAQINRYFAGSNDAVATRVAYLNFDQEIQLAADPTALLEHLDTLLLAGSMSDALKSRLLTHLNNLPNTEAGLSLRVRDAVTLIMASPDYLIQM